MLLRHQEGLLNSCHIEVPFGVVEVVNDNVKALLRRGRGYRNLRYREALREWNRWEGERLIGERRLLISN